MDQTLTSSEGEPSTLTYGFVAEDLTSGASSLRRGSCLGRYVLLHCLGSGGMGHVFAAYDPELDRKIALKVLRAELWSSGNRDTAKQLLLREARATAQLSHAHVVSIYDIGTADNRLFIGMELIAGVTFTEWMEHEKPSWRRVLEVLAQAGEGLAAAHRAGIVHRDFKPGNLMVSHGGDAKVVDFGLAKIFGDCDSEASYEECPNRLPREGSQQAPATFTGLSYPHGTPAYMAPEQWLGRVADRRSDQFSFCVTAYEALYGVSAFVGRSRHDGTTRKRSREVREPPASSTVPGRVRRALLRGLSTDPEDRFGSMEQLLVELRHDSKHPGRRWMLVATGLAVFAGAAAGLYQERLEKQQLCTGAENRLVGIWDSSQKADIRQGMLAAGSPRAEDTWHLIEGQINNYGQRWVEAHTEICEATHLRGEQSPILLDRQMACLDQRRTELTTLTSLLRAADTPVVDNAVAAVASLSGIAGCLDRRQALYGMPPPEPAAAPRVAEVRRQIAEAKTIQAAGQYPRALKLATDGLKASEEVGYPPLIAEAHFRLGLAYGRLGQPGELRRQLGEAVSLGQSSGHRKIVAAAMVHLMAYGFLTQDSSLSSLWGRMAKGAVDAAGGYPELESQRLLMLGITAEMEGRYESAIAHYLDSLEASPEKTLFLQGSVLNNIGQAYHRLGDLDAAEDHLLQAISVTEQAYGSWHPLVGYSLQSLANLLDDRGSPMEAIDLRQRVLGIFEATPGVGHPVFVEELMALSRNFLAIGEPARALPYLERALRLTGGGPEGKSASLSVSAELHFLLARTLIASRRDPARARLLAQEARNAYATLGSDTRPNTASNRVSGRAPYPRSDWAVKLAEVDLWMQEESDARRL